MKKIESFRVNHTALVPGVYVSRIDYVHDAPVTTYDVRLVRPNTPAVLSPAVMHTIEHLGATYLRNSSLADEVIYFGPMGCRTGFYLILQGNRPPIELKDILTDTFSFIAGFHGDIPGASAEECGNYTDMDLTGAKAESLKYLAVLSQLTAQNTCYPE